VTSLSMPLRRTSPTASDGLALLGLELDHPLAASVPNSTLADDTATCTVSRSLGLMSLMRDGT